MMRWKKIADIGTWQTEFIQIQEKKDGFEACGPVSVCVCVCVCEEVSIHSFIRLNRLF